VGRGGDAVGFPESLGPRPTRLRGWCTLKQWDLKTRAGRRALQKSK
jgi:hypothetical protein